MQRALPGLDDSLDQKPAIIFIGSFVSFSNDLVALVEASFPGLQVKRFAALADFLHAGEPVHEATVAIILDENHSQNIELSVSQMRKLAPGANQALSYRDLDRAAEIVRQVSHHADLTKLSFLPMRMQYDSWRSMLSLLVNGESYMPRELVEASRLHIAEPRQHSHPPVALADTAPTRAPATAVRPILTDRELEVLDLVAKGRQNKNVAADLGLSEHTVKLHMHNIINKLGVSNRTAATVWYMSQRDSLD